MYPTGMRLGGWYTPRVLPCRAAVITASRAGVYCYVSVSSRGDMETRADKPPLRFPALPQVSPCFPTPCLLLDLGHFGQKFCAALLLATSPYAAPHCPTLPCAAPSRFVYVCLCSGCVSRYALAVSLRKADCALVHRRGGRQSEQPSPTAGPAPCHQE